MRAELLEDLLSLLRGPLASPEVVLMPDFYLDHFVRFDGELEAFVRSLREMAERGGGNFPMTAQAIMRGGNAANTAAALSKLGGRPYLVAKADGLGLWFLERRSGLKGPELRGVKAAGSQSMTVALELRYGGRLINLMINDPGPVRDFGPSDLDEGDVEAVRRADFVCVLNWAQNSRGTELIQEVFGIAKREGVGKTFLDTGDPSPKRDEIRALLRKVLGRGLVDVWSLNENEAKWYSSAMGFRAMDAQCFEMGRFMHEELGVIIDLHTSDFSSTHGPGGDWVVDSLPIAPLRKTGAGDAWNAADILGHSMRLNPELRLALSNAAASYYISNEEGRHASAEDLRAFLEGFLGNQS